MNSLLNVLLIYSSLQAVTAEPTISFPFNAQLPPVARIGSLYAYSFSPHTFRSDLNITYSLGQHPEWLSLGSSERRLYGVPEDKDVPPGEVVGQDFQLIATDDTGSATLDATIVISREEGPAIQIPISEQVKQFGDYSAPASILTYPSTGFKYTFDTNTFKHEPGMINYYASSGNSSPLPAWISFDAPSLTFTGTTPGADALFQPPQRFDIRLVASDIEGFSSTSVEFAIVVSSHKLTADEPVITLNASRGESVEYDGLAEGIKLDGQAVSPGDLDVSPANFPGWLKFDEQTWSIQGKPGKDDHSTNFTIRFTDEFSDTLEVWGMVNVASGLFETTFHDVEATPGEDFSLDLSDHFQDPGDIQVQIDTEPEQDWLKLDGLELKGKVPKSAKGDLGISIQARSRSSGRTETETLTMNFLAPDGSTTMTSTTSTFKPSSTSGDDEKDDEDDEGKNSDKDQANDDDDDMSTSVILLATIIPILVIALLIILIACLVRRRRSRRTYLTNKKFRTKISHPVNGSLKINGSFHDDKAPHTEKAGFAGYTIANSHRTSHSSDTLGSLSSRDLSHMYMHNAGPERSYGSSGTEDGRESWFTMDRTPTAMRSEMSTRSRGSEVTVPYSTHQLLPTPPFLAQTHEGFRSGLDLTIPSLDDLPSLQETSQPAQRSTGFYSTITTSSAALPSSPKFLPATTTTIINRPSPLIKDRPATATGSRSKSNSSKDWSTIREDESVPSLPPRPARLSSANWLTRRNASERDSTFSQASFASSENWRVIGHHGRSAPNLSSYNEIVETSPWHPSTRDTKGESSNLGGSQGAGVKVETMVQETKPESVKDNDGQSEVRWVRPQTSRSRYSKLNESESKGSSSGWRSEKSKDSEGSFKVFI